jgi:branched-chain amino acid transport system permease protein
VLAGAIAGLAGGFYAHYVGVVAPTIISFALVMDLFAMVIVGGIGTFWGPILGTAVISALTVYIQGSHAQYQSLVVAAALVIMVLFFRTGLIGILRSLRHRPRQQGAG